MRLQLALIAVIGIISEATSRITFGGCATGVKGLSFSEYSAKAVTEKTAAGVAPNPDTYTKRPWVHTIMAMDRGFFEAVESFKAFGFKPYFDYRCDRLNKVEPWKSIASR